MSLENFKNDHPTFIPEKMKLGNIKNDISSSGMKFTESKLIGSTSGKEKQFNGQVGNERVPVMGFIAAKNKPAFKHICKSAAVCRQACSFVYFIHVRIVYDGPLVLAAQNTEAQAPLSHWYLSSPVSKRRCWRK